MALWLAYPSVQGHGKADAHSFSDLAQGSENTYGIGNVCEHHGFRSSLRACGVAVVDVLPMHLPRYLSIHKRSRTGLTNNATMHDLTRESKRQRQQVHKSRLWVGIRGGAHVPTPPAYRH
ncbi:hypothetical protein PMIN05_007013 [Paraphaeosphaeria minitans]